jgi:hypothetical protein
VVVVRPGAVVAVSDRPSSSLVVVLFVVAVVRVRAVVVTVGARSSPTSSMDAAGSATVSRAIRFAAKPRPAAKTRPRRAMTTIRMRPG